MKILAVFSALLLLTACCRDPDPPTPEPEQPQVRNNQMYALVNGGEWRTCGPPQYPKYIVQNFRGEYLYIRGSNFCQGGDIYLKIWDFNGEGIYPLGSITNNTGIYIGDQEYSTVSDHTGTLNITKVDSTDRQDGSRLPSEITGTFSFSALGEDSTSTVEITDGQFVTLDVYNF